MAYVDTAINFTVFHHSHGASTHLSTIFEFLLQAVATILTYICAGARDLGNNSLSGTIPIHVGNSLTFLYVLLTLVSRSK